MTKLYNIIKYICDSYPHKEELSVARLTKLVFLSDWFHLVETKKRLTNIDWYFDNYGPFVWEVIDTARSEVDLFEIKEVSTMFGTPKTLVYSKGSKHKKLEKSAENAINQAISETEDLTFNEFINFVYDQEPVKGSKKYSNIDLEKFVNIENI